MNQDNTEVIEKLFIWGCDTDEAIQRLVGDEELYLSFIERYCVNEDIDRLDQYILNKDIENAHGLAHTMKGVYGNLGITPIYDILTDIVHVLKAGSFDGVPEKMMELHDAKEELDELVGGD